MSSQEDLPLSSLYQDNFKRTYHFNRVPMAMPNPKLSCMPMVLSLISQPLLFSIKQSAQVSDVAQGPLVKNVMWKYSDRWSSY